MPKQECVLEISLGALSERIKKSQDWMSFLHSFERDNITLKKDAVVRALAAINYQGLPLNYQRIKLTKSFDGQKGLYSKMNKIQMQCIANGPNFITKALDYNDYCVKPKESFTDPTYTTFSAPNTIDLRNFTLGVIHQQILDSENSESAAKRLGVSLERLEAHLKSYHFSGLELSFAQLKKGILTRELLSGIHFSEPSSHKIPADQLFINYWQCPMRDLKQNLSHLDIQSTQEIILHPPLAALPPYLPLEPHLLFQNASTFFNTASLMTQQSNVAVSNHEPGEFTSHQHRADKRGTLFTPAPSALTQLNLVVDYSTNAQADEPPTPTYIDQPKHYYSAKEAREKLAQLDAHQRIENIDPTLPELGDSLWSFMEMPAP